MRKRPVAVTIISWVFITVGCVALGYHLLPQHVAELMQESSSWMVVWICAVRALAIVAGAFMLRGCNWARWLAGCWMAYHVVLSAFHPVSELVVHGVLLIVIVYFLFRRQASTYFQRQGTESRPTDAEQHPPGGLSHFRARGS